MRKALKRSMAAREQLRAQRQEAELEKRKMGLAGQRVGKHKVPEGEIDVQLGDELSESLRALKVRGHHERIGVRLIELKWLSAA